MTDSQPPSRRRGARATIRDVAAHAGVSKSLVSLVLSGGGSVSDESRAAVHAAIAALNYRPNAMARGLVRRRTRRLGVLISDLRNPFFGDLASGLLHRARQAGYEVVFNTGDRDSELEELAIDALLELRTDGLLLAAPQVDPAVLERAARETPTVVLNRHFESELCDCVTDDDFLGGQLAVEHLVRAGHRRLAHIDGGPGAGAAPRRAGFEHAAREHGCGAQSRVVAGSFTEDGGFRGARELLAATARPTAIFAANDLAAVGAISAIEEEGLAVPGDISVMGYDNSFLAGLRHLSLTSVDQAAKELGRMAVDRLLERLEQGRTRAVRDVVPPSLVVRGSTAPPRPEAE